MGSQEGTYATKRCKHGLRPFDKSRSVRANAHDEDQGTPEVVGSDLPLLG